MSTLLLRLLRPGGLLDFRTDVERYALDAVERLEEAGFENALGPGRFAERGPRRDPLHPREALPRHRPAGLAPAHDPPPGVPMKRRPRHRRPSPPSRLALAPRRPRLPAGPPARRRLPGAGARHGRAGRGGGLGPALVGDAGAAGPSGPGSPPRPRPGWFRRAPGPCSPAMRRWRCVPPTSITVVEVGAGARRPAGGGARREARATWCWSGSAGAGASTCRPSSRSPGSLCYLSPSPRKNETT